MAHGGNTKITHCGHTIRDNEEFSKDETKNWRRKQKHVDVRPHSRVRARAHIFTHAHMCTCEKNMSVSEREERCVRSRSLSEKLSRGTSILTIIVYLVPRTM